MAATLVVLFVILYLTSHFIIISPVTMQERTDLEKSIDYILQELEMELGDLDALLNNYSTWDETHNLLRQPNQDIADDFFHAGELERLRLNLILIAGPEGEVMFARYLDPALQRAAPLPQSLRALLSSGSHLVRQPVTGFGVKTILALPEGGLLIAARPILPTSGDGPPVGTILMGRFIKPDRTNPTADQRLDSLEFYSADGVPTPADIQTDWTALVKQSAAAQFRLFTASPTLISIPDENTITGLRLLYGIADQPIGLRVTARRVIYRLHAFMVRQVLIITLLTGFILLLVNLLLLQIVGFKKLGLLSSQVMTIAGQGNVKARVQLEQGSGRKWSIPDEITLLAGQINQMLAALEENQRQQQESKLRYQAVVEQSQEGVVLVDASSQQILEANPAFQAMTGYSADELLQMTLYEISAQSRDHVDDISQCVLTNGRCTAGDHCYRHKDGSLIDVEVCANLIQFHDRHVVCILTRNITERKQAEREKREIDMRYRQLVELSPDAVILIHHGKIVFANSTMVRLAGASCVEEVLNRDPLDFVHPDSRPALFAALEMVTIQPTTPLLEERVLDREGSEAYLQISAAQIPYNHSGATQIILRDVTDHRRAEQERRAQERSLTLLNQITQLAASAMDFQSTIQLLVDQLGLLLEADGCYLTLWDEDTQTVQPTAAYGMTSEAYRAVHYEPGEITMTSSVMKVGRTLVVEDVFNTPYISSSLAARYPVRSSLALPLVAGEEKLGALLITFHQPHSFSPDEIARAEKAAGPVALAVAKARLFDDHKKSLAELTRAYDITLGGWAKAMELRDKETEGHAQRVTDLTVRLGRRMSICGEDLTNLFRGALLHDIGKMGLPDSILLKPGPLTDEEWAMMSQHPVYAYQWLAPIQYLHGALDIPYCHHEKWDGTGYPRGLKGTEIPLPARIFAVIDVWDALISDRPYRKAHTREEALAYIRAQPGAHFDPVVVEAFLELLEEDV